MIRLLKSDTVLLWKARMLHPLKWMGLLRSRRERLDTYTRSTPPTLRQDRWVRVTTCRDHVICMAWGHVTSKPCKPTGAGARRARIASHASHPVRELAELALRAVRAIRCEGSQSLQTILYISSEEFPYGILIFNSCCDPDY